MADLNTLVQQMGPGLGHMLGLQQFDNNQAQVQAQTQATLENALRTQQTRQFEAQNQPHTLEELLQKNRALQLANQGAFRENQINSGISVEEMIQQRKQKMQEETLKRISAGMPTIIGTAAALPENVERLGYVQNEMLKLGAPKTAVEQLSRIGYGPELIEALKTGLGRVQGEATPKINSAENIANSKLDVTRELGYARMQNELQKAQMRQVIDEARLKIATAKASGNGAKIPKRLEEALVKANMDAQEARKRGDEKAEAEALSMASLYASQIAAINVTKQPTGSMLQGSTIIPKPTGPNAAAIPVVPSQIAPTQTRIDPRTLSGTITPETKKPQRTREDILKQYSK